MKILHVVGTVLVILFAGACKPTAIRTVEPDVFEQMLARTSDSQLVDVRTLKEFGEGHLPGAVLIDVKSVDFDSLILTLDKACPVFVYCRSGKRSLDAAGRLEKYGFKAVYDLGGGINAWKTQGKAVIMP